jgi:hypothetical protein
MPEAGMDRSAVDRAEREITGLLEERFPGAVQQVALLQHGDDPMVEPGELLVRVFINPAAGQDAQDEAMGGFMSAHREELKQFQSELSARLPGAKRLLFTTTDAADGGRPRMMMRLEPRGDEPPDRGLTPVMARLGPADLETLDALITAGIAASRADAIRWALGRIRERPAYRELRERAREIERLKNEF